MNEEASPEAVPTALNHLHLTVDDPEAEIRFLTQALGFKRDPSHPSFVWLGNMQMTVSKGEPIRHARFHLGFRMDSSAHVDALRTRLQRFGVTSTEPSADGSYYSCYFTDPAGYRFEIYAEGGISALGTLPE